MNSGLLRHWAVIRWPGSTPSRSTSTVDRASTSAEGFMASISGQSAAAVPTAAVVPVGRYKKSRRVSLLFGSGPSEFAMSFAMADLRITALPGHTRLETLPAGLAEQRGRLGAVVQLRSVDMAMAAAAVREV